MILPGWTSTSLGKLNLKRFTCENCNVSGFIFIEVLGRYLHTWGIPIIPLGKRGVATCEACGTKWKTRKMPENIKFEYKNFSYTVKTPIWQYSGAVVLTIFVLWIYQEIGNDKIDELNYKDNPAIGDIYEYQINEDKFSTFRVFALDSNAIYVKNNLLSAPSRYKLSKMDMRHNYVDSIYSLSRQEVNKMYAEEIIFGIDRY